MGCIVSRKKNNVGGAASLLVSALSVASLSGLAVAEEEAEREASVLLPAVKVSAGAEPHNPSQPEPVSPKFTAPLLNTPKSVTVISRELMEQRGAASLADVLRTTPGISLGSGEGGTPVGDRPFIRGYEASTDMFIDGIRDLGRFAHESFNIEQVEVIKGPSSAYSGRGSTGGSINMVSKKPQAENFIAGSGSVGTDDYFRGTIDVNQVVTDNMAVRLNYMSHSADTPGRDYGDANRWGFAPSVTYSFSPATAVTLSHYLLRAEDTPDLGHPFAIDGSSRPARVSRDNFYGVAGRDKRINDADITTLDIVHSFNDNLHLRNVTRVGESTSQYIMSRPTIDAASGMVNRDVRTGNRKSQTEANQTDLSGSFLVGGILNNFATGLEFMEEKLKTGDVPDSALFAVDRVDLHNPNAFDPVYTGPRLSSFSSSQRDLSNRTKSKAFYAFNTAELSPQWQVNLGVRYDDYKVSDGSVSNDSDFWNYQAGVVFKPAENGSIYISYGTSSNPSGETAGQSGGADGSAGGGLGGSRPNLDPEKNRSYELGTKWDVFDNQLSLTAAVFRTEKTNQRATDPLTGEVALVGDNRTNGLELGVSGNITDRWSVYGGYTYLDPELTDDGAGDNDGNRLKFIAKRSLALWTTYEINALTIGGGATYMSDRWMNDANTLGVPSYWRYDVMASYAFNQHVELQLNVQNLTDETIYEGSHVGLFANIGPGRLGLMTLNFKF